MKKISNVILHFKTTVCDSGEDKELDVRLEDVNGYIDDNGNIVIENYKGGSIYYKNNEQTSFPDNLQHDPEPNIFKDTFCG